MPETSTLIMLRTATVVISLFALSKACNYVRDPNWEEEYCDMYSCWTYTKHRDGSVPLGYCQTNARNDTETDYSEMFLCTSWDQLFHFSWNATDCMGVPEITEVISNSGYQCQSTETCQIFNVRSNTLDPNNAYACQENTERYDEIVLVADECFVERDEGENGTVSWRSIKPVCTDSDSVS